METINCIHKNKVNCTFCSDEVFGKSIQWHINDWYQANVVGERSRLALYWNLKAYMEQKEAFERSL